MAFGQPKLLGLHSLLQARSSSAVEPQLQKDYLTPFWKHEMIQGDRDGYGPSHSFPVSVSGTEELRSERLPEPMSNQGRVGGGEVDGSEPGPSTA